MRKLTKIERASYTVIITRDITESTLVEVRSGSPSPSPCSSSPLLIRWRE
jgi:hypothetical protein